MLKRRFFIFSGLTFLVLAFSQVYYMIRGNASEMGVFGGFEALLRFVVYAGIIMAWGFSIGRRYIRKAVSGYLIGVCVLMMVWLFIRTAKWYIDVPASQARYLWYLYYGPILFIPLLFFLASLFLSKPENYRLPGTINLLFGFTGFLFLIVMTNDIHGLVFRIADTSNIDDYTYGPCYFLIVAWIAMCAGSALFVMISRSSRSSVGKRRFIPFILMGAAVIYSIAYAKNLVNVELMAVFDWLSVVTWESCVYIGLIPTNSNYREFFRQSSIRASIVDEEGKTYIASLGATPLDREGFENLKLDGTGWVDQETMLHISKVNCGYMVWQEDVSKFNEMLEELKANEAELIEENTIAEQEMKAAYKSEQIKEKNRLYTLLTQRMSGGLRKIDGMIEELEKEKDPEKRFDLLCRVNLFGVYLKRRSNFIIMGEGGEKIDASEMRLCLDELGRALELCGIFMEAGIFLNNAVSVDSAVSFLDRILKDIADSEFKKGELSVIISDRSGDPRVSLDRGEEEA